MNPIARFSDVGVTYKGKANLFSKQAKKDIVAVKGVNLDIMPNQIVGLVGESGSGKSTLGNTLIGTVPIAEGKIEFQSRVLQEKGYMAHRKNFEGIQMIYQDPSSSLCPTMRIEDILAEPIKINRIKQGIGINYRIRELMEMVEMDELYLKKYPHQLSGGQKQRIAVARAMAMGPKLIIADEPTSALDVSVQASLLNLFLSLKNKEGVSFLFISHNLAVVRHVSDVVAVMRGGEIVEQNTPITLFKKPQEEYTKKLISVIPTVKKHVNVENVPYAINY